ncbi:MAG: ATP phosphoribosyltransferase regulatory subunit [Phycisphaerales bacterium]|nr:ATP phosphoribosyltransferase regulatory subunit [Phycisphaerales bacterium]
MSGSDNPVSSAPGPGGFQGPPGTRDLYPDDVLRSRYVTEAWRAASIRHGFDEIDGPTFETCALYAVKSGEGILGELFQAFSGKSPEERQRVRETGQAPYALRPEFTPTLARMYAAKAGSLPRPTRWFMVGPFFRAERPQRGRLREFVQWNCDVIGLDVDWLPVKGAAPDAEAITRAKARADAEVVACCVGAIEALGLKSADITVRIADRNVTAAVMRACGVPDARQGDVLGLLDRRAKMPPAQYAQAALDLGFDAARLDSALRGLEDQVNAALGDREQGRSPAEPRDDVLRPLFALVEELARQGVARWCRFDFGIVRGLAYYTGMVFEVVVDGERAVAGGGRYDNLIELFGGPPTPAVGFGMGDVVLSLVLVDKGLMPGGKALLEALESPVCRANLRPDVFVLPSPAEGMEALVRPLLGELRHAGLHARSSSRSTRNLGKLLKDAETACARFAAIIESPDRVTLKNLDTREEHKDIPREALPSVAGSRRGALRTGGAMGDPAT